MGRHRIVHWEHWGRVALTWIMGVGPFKEFLSQRVFSGVIITSNLGVISQTCFTISPQMTYSVHPFVKDKRLRILLLSRTLAMLATDMNGAMRSITQSVGGSVRRRGRSQRRHW